MYIFKRRKKCGKLQKLPATSVGYSGAKRKSGDGDGVAGGGGYYNQKKKE